MFGWLKNLLGRESLGRWIEVAGTTVPRGVASTPRQETPAVRWLSKDDPKNPFRVDGYDCLGFVRSMLSTTRDQSIAASFVKLRATNGQEHIGRLPEDPIEVECQLEYSFDGKVGDGRLCKATRMEEKWDIYLYEKRIYFARSWAGNLALVAQFDTIADKLRVIRIWVSKDGAQDVPYVLRHVDYLIKSHIIGQPHPHPLPRQLERDPSKVGLFSFGLYGYECCFGTFDETLIDGIRKPNSKATGA